MAPRGRKSGGWGTLRFVALAAEEDQGIGFLTASPAHVGRGGGGREEESDAGNGGELFRRLEHFHFYSVQASVEKCGFFWGKAAPGLAALYTPEVKML
jgi:hypothetical protein